MCKSSSSERIPADVEGGRTGFDGISKVWRGIEQRANMSEAGLVYYQVKGTAFGMTSQAQGGLGLSSLNIWIHKAALIGVRSLAT